jgi:DNA repair exonuclease SbcCD ATPase subunit
MSKGPLPDILFDLDSDEAENRQNDFSCIKETIEERNSIDKQNKELASSVQIWKSLARSRQKEMKVLKNTSNEYQEQIRNLVEEFDQYKGNFEVYATIIKETIEELSRERDPESREVFDGCANRIGFTLERLSAARVSQTGRKSQKERMLEEEIKELEAKKETFKSLLVGFYQVQYGMEVGVEMIENGGSELCEKSPSPRSNERTKFDRGQMESYGEVVQKLTGFLEKNSQENTQIDIVTLLEVLDSEEYSMYDDETRNHFKDVFRKLYEAGQKRRETGGYKVKSKKKGFFGFLFCC